MPSFYDTFMSIPLQERKRIVADSGLTLGYVQKHIYTSEGRDPKFHFHNAVRLDAASGGELSFINNTEGSVDWDFVRKRLNKARRMGVI